MPFMNALKVRGKLTATSGSALSLKRREGGLACPSYRLRDAFASRRSTST